MGNSSIIAAPFLLLDHGVTRASSLLNPFPSTSRLRQKRLGSVGRFEGGVKGMVAIFSDGPKRSVRVSMEDRAALTLQFPLDDRL